MSGRKVLGCCVHISTVIYYLSYAKYYPIKKPGDFLNSVLVNRDSRVLSNRPDYIKNTRKIKIINPGNKTNESDDQDSEFDEQDTEFEDEEKVQDEPITSTYDFISDFKTHVPFWGANITYKKKLVYVTNTCTIDNFLFAFWVLFKIVPDFFEKILPLDQRETIIEIVEKIQNNDWNEAKELWIIKVMKYNRRIKDGTISLFGSKSSHFLDYLSKYQEHKLIQSCKTRCSENGKAIRDDSDKIFFRFVRKKLCLYSGLLGKCRKCRSNISSTIRFKNNPFFLFIESINQNIFLNQIPLNITIDNLRFALLCVTIHKPGHFVSVFIINERFYLIDDLDQSTTQLIDAQDDRLKSLNVSVSLYFKM